MESAARKRKIDPKALLALCALALAVLTIWAVYAIVEHNAELTKQRDEDRRVCELAAALRGETLAYAEVLCAR